LILEEKAFLGGLRKRKYIDDDKKHPQERMLKKHPMNANYNPREGHPQTRLHQLRKNKKTSSLGNLLTIHMRFQPHQKPSYFSPSTTTKRRNGEWIEKL